MPADGRVVLVTGGASGLGAAIVSALTAVARAVLLPFELPPGCELRELVVAPAGDGSWPP
jgi:NAD(P)-dependent dehydrogenase (short-subunit alcohol dehydrogenase family)